MSIDLYEKLSEKRKKQQEQGVLPQWYTTAGLQLFEQKYLYEAENVKEQFERIARTAAKHLIGTKFEAEAESKFFEMLWKGWLSPSTPVLANMGTSRGMPVSCSGSYIQDSIDGFYSGRREVALLTKQGFGTASYLGDIRPRGSMISVGGKASGAVPVFKGFVQDMRDVAQGTARRGAWAGYIEIDHGDFDELANFIMDEQDDANVGWIITDAFIEKLKSNDQDSIRRYQKAMKLKMVTGKGYFFFVDKANRKRPEMYKDLGLTIKNSQLCLTGDTIIEISDQQSGENSIKIRLDDFCDTFFNSNPHNIYVKSYDGENTVWSKISNAALTGMAEDLIEIESENGNIIRCTPDHQILTKNRGWVAAKDLEETDILVE